jgi:hypothetical protein
MDYDHEELLAQIEILKSEILKSRDLTSHVQEEADSLRLENCVLRSSTHTFAVAAPPSCSLPLPLALPWHLSPPRNPPSPRKTST